MKVTQTTAISNEAGPVSSKDKVYNVKSLSVLPARVADQFDTVAELLSGSGRGVTVTAKGKLDNGAEVEYKLTLPVGAELIAPTVKAADADETPAEKTPEEIAAEEAAKLQEAASARHAGKGTKVDATA